MAERHSADRRGNVKPFKDKTCNLWGLNPRGLTSITALTLRLNHSAKVARTYVLPLPADCEGFPPRSTNGEYPRPDARHPPPARRAVPDNRRPHRVPPVPAELRAASERGKNGPKEAGGAPPPETADGHSALRRRRAVRRRNHESAVEKQLPAGKNRVSDVGRTNKCGSERNDKALAAHSEDRADATSAVKQADLVAGLDKPSPNSVAA